MRPTEEDQEALEILAKRDDLSSWEEEFLISLDERRDWTAKQAAKFDEVWERKMNPGGA